MYYSPRRRGDYGVAGARARQKPADAHSGAYQDFLRRHELEAISAARGDAAVKQSFITKLFQRTADTRNLRLAWDWLASTGGQAPGADGLRFDDLDEPEVWSFLRTLSRSIRQQTYWTSQDRKKKIPKTSGKGFRMLAIPSIVDRLVQRAIVQIIQPYLDFFFDDNCLGYRPGSDILKALARAEQLTVTEEGWVWLTEDLRDAFDNVPQKRLLDILHRYIPEQEMLSLIEQVVLTTTKRGVRQGGNLSPLLLNVYLHHFLDTKWRRQHPDIPLLRWADDLLVLCKSTTEASQAYQDLQRLLAPTGMTLKGTPEQAIHDLQNDEPADWLGYRLQKETNGLTVTMTEDAWKSLAEKLEQDQEKDCSPLRAIQTIKGWISQLGPCFDSSDITQASTRIVTLAHSHAFDELPSREQIAQEWQSAYRRWQYARRSVNPNSHR
jgi:group II intron reverse transcriptase/maturase